jgi:anti-sigma-K factor RskA
MMTHDDASMLLGAFSIDAVDAAERELIEAHLAECPRCRAELDGYRDVAAAMGNTIEPLPDGLWSGIVSRLPERADEEPPPMPRLVSNGASSEPAVRSHRRRRPRMPHGPLATVGTIAMAVAAVAVVLGIGLVRADNQVNQDQQAISQQSTSSAVVTALETSGHKVVDLDSADHARLAQFVMVPDGRGYLVTSSLPKLSGKQVYQLWGIIGKQPISLGLLGSSPKASAFTASTSPSPTQLSITVEPAGGSVVPSSPVLATGTV